MLMLAYLLLAVLSFFGAGVLSMPSAIASGMKPATGTPITNSAAFSYWSGSSYATYTNGPGGEYSVQWSGDGSFIGGKGWNPGAARQISFTALYSSTGNSFLSVYGWTVNPLTEYFIIEDYGTYNPAIGGVFRGSVTSDGSVYDIYTVEKVNQPTIIGTATYYQYFSIRQTQRSSGTVTTANHFNAWSTFGLALGIFEYQIFATVGGDGTGTSTVTVGGT